MTSTVKQIDTIRRTIKSAVPTVSVKSMQGYMIIHGSGSFQRFTEVEIAGLANLGYQVGLANCFVISPDDLAKLNELRAQQ